MQQYICQPHERRQSPVALGTRVCLGHLLQLREGKRSGEGGHDILAARGRLVQEVLQRRCSKGAAADG